jgi:hypothetical protein
MLASFSVCLLGAGFVLHRGQFMVTRMTVGNRRDQTVIWVAVNYSLLVKHCSGWRLYTVCQDCVALLGMS